MKGWRIAGIILSGVAVAAVIATLYWPSRPVLIVPLQVRTTNGLDPAGSSADSSAWTQRLLARAAEPDRPGFTQALQEYLDAPPDSRDPDSEATAMGLAARHIRDALAQDRIPAAASICLRARWSALRINRLAGPCHEAVSKAPARTNAPVQARTADRIVLIGAGDAALYRAAQAYLTNPYDGERLAELALGLARAGDLVAAERLLEELLQIDRMAAGQLDHDLAEARGVTHQGHAFEFEASGESP